MSAACVAAVFVVAGSVIYVWSCVVWLHAPIPQVLLLTVPILLILLALAFGCGKLGSTLWKTESRRASSQGPGTHDL
jgi:hypothetical protein